MSLDLRLRAQRELHGQFLIHEELGRGGMAVVYRATDLRDDSPVAIKLMFPSVATQLGVNRFLREVALAGSLEHPNILTVLGTGEVDGLPFYVMPLVKGHSLRTRLNPALASLDDVVDIAVQTADALQYAHTRDVLHRDIKPENLLMDGRHVIVTDFGVGKALNAAGGSSLTATGFVVGTPAYMSPEQAAGDPDLDGRSDLYSLGIVMYEMIAGVLPFTGKNVQQLMAQRFLSRPRALQQLRDDVPDPLAAIVHRLLEEHPADRFADAADTAAALRRLQHPQ
jgi:serine/threonine-protein kinase